MKQKLSYLRNNPLLIFLIIWYLAAWSWAFTTDSLDLAGSKAVAMSIATWVVIFNVFISTYIVRRFFKYLQKRFVGYKNWQILVLGLPLFALMDFLISWFTAVIWLGPQGSIDNVLPLSSPALLLINTPFGFAARLVGFYGLAAFFWLTLFMIVNKKYRIYSLACVGLLTILSVAGWQLYKTPNGSTVKATIISENLNNHVGVIQGRDSDLVVFPEYGLDDTDGDDWQTRIAKTNGDNKTYFLGSKQVFDKRPSGHLNVLMFGNSESGPTLEQDKYRLIPGGEDLGYIIRTALRATNQKGTLDYFSYAKMVNKGEKPLQPLRMDQSTLIGSAVCSSIIAPKDYQDFASKGATIFTNSASLTIFQGSRVFAWQQKSLARFMAVSNSRYFLQSANAASAYLLDNNGKQLAEVRGIEAKDVVAINNSQKTPYTYVGEILAFLGFTVAIAWLIQFLGKRKRIKRKVSISRKR